MEFRRIAILGAGNGGLAAAADLSSQGYEIRVFELPRFYNHLSAIKNKGGIFLKKDGERHFVKFHLVTKDISEAVSGTDLIMLIVPSYAIEEFAELVGPHIEEGQIIFINGSASMASVRFKRTVESLGITTSYKICETSTLTYGTRRVGDLDVEIFLEVKNVLFSALPGSDTNALINKCQTLYKSLEAVSNVWETCLNNGNPESHPAPTLLNAGRIEFSEGNFYLYKEGITEGVENLIYHISMERRALCEALGIRFIPSKERLIRTGYCKPAGSLHQMYQQSFVFENIKGPEQLNSRYLTEDVPMGLTLWSSLGKELKIKTPVIDSVICLSGALHKKDYFTEGLTLKKLGFANMNAHSLIEAVN